MIRTFVFFLLVIFFGGCVVPLKTSNNIIKKDSTVANNPLALQPDKFKTKFDQGIDFIASGNEPFWSLEIDFDKSMHFKMPDGFEIKTPAVEGVKAMDANVTRYAGKTEQGLLIVQIQKLECINDMSGEKLDYTVTVDIKNNTDKDYSTYKGCGRYLSDYRLQDIWVLDSINKKKMHATDFMKGLPYLEFNLTEKKILGHTGCNNINCTMEVLGKKIKFGNISATRMACKNMEFEPTYLQMLDSKTISYYIKPGKLYLQVSSDSLFVYRKVD